MTELRSKWLGEISLETPSQRTDKTAKSPFVSNVSTVDRRSEPKKPDNCLKSGQSANIVRFCEKPKKHVSAPQYDDPADWQELFNERAGVLEYDGEMTRQDAEDGAFDCCVTEWMNRHPVTPSPDACLACNAGETSTTPLLPYGAESNGHAWLHAKCWPDWYKGRKAKAASSLTAMGIKAPNSLGELE